MTRLTGIAILASAVAPLALMAQEGSQKIGAINMQAAMTGTQEGKKAADALAAKLEPRKKVLDGKAAEIRGLQDKLQRGGAAMAETAKADLTRQIDERTKSYNRDMEDAQAELNDEQRVLISQMSNKMTTIIDKYAQEHGFHIIFDVSNPNTPLLYISNLIDVTRDVIELYDKANPATADSKPAPAPKPAVPATKK